jgi:hypothetical protein
LSTANKILEKPAGDICPTSEVLPLAFNWFRLSTIGRVLTTRQHNFDSMKGGKSLDYLKNCQLIGISEAWT